MRALLFSLRLLISTIAWGSFIRFWFKKDSHLGSPIFASSKKNVMFFSFLVVFLQSLLGNRKQKQVREKKTMLLSFWYHLRLLSKPANRNLNGQTSFCVLMLWPFSFGEAGSRPQHLLHGRQGFHFTINDRSSPSTSLLPFYEIGSLCSHGCPRAHRHTSASAPECWDQGCGATPHLACFISWRSC